MKCMKIGREAWGATLKESKNIHVKRKYCFAR